ncbi:CDP-diacylglycerol--glycerol-3-phosphate 3-phosphatidyltransferase [Celeribacter halophilus]|uniref:CDP-diacylglycerol--glycerol-3-phosphate 3-phosphatidyltransferase n=1 Tax=Celeribacter halophilus TaxID=576117 RepID=A0A1I3UTZ8_9RHOB|nr:CDP-diacylglycerol--glycerol-3-phosphate 3-phosphatidyltransferase [Celeribacter halophilus]PZX10040.1 CDP-diacylglycerol--glycerol-3-phosphate 3-phosphatidyltransferase [Celeribacter halophilus]SFJ85327.1 CDP-diacylglycerol--glycerol-3-phosphate 3-phosphatidyltransferase [Celeribacter halophilus]
MTWNLPNILTVFRLLCAPGVALVFLVLPRPVADWVALILFASASVTDFLDGYLARKWDQMSKFGAMLDPIADKAMVVTAIAVLTMLHGVNPLIVIPAAFILLRETFVSGLREFLGDTAGTLKVTKLAKWKTTAQMVAIAVLFAYGATASAPLFTLGLLIFWIAGLLTVITGWDYLSKAMPYLRDHHED